MGVPGFWGGWLKKFFINYKEFKGSSSSSPNVVVNTFSIDMNGVLHACLNKVNSDASMEGRSEEEVEDAFIQEIHHELTRICNKFCRDGGCQAVIICVDGVAPVAKMMQQRSRRFKASIMTGSSSEGKIDRNSLSPGTRIMERIEKAIDFWGDSKDAPAGLEFINSHHRVPGEGEHKIFTMLKQRSLQKPGFANLIYGLDADFTMISLVSEVKNIWLVREEELKEGYVPARAAGSASGAAAATGSSERYYPTHSTTLLSIDSLKKALKDNFMGSRGSRLSQLSDDFVCVMSLLGNDFVPRVPDVGDVGRWIEQLLTTYRELGIPLTERSTMESGSSFPKIILKNFKTFLERLSEKESGNLVEIATTRFKYPHTMVIECSERKTTIRGDSKTSVNIPLLKRRWYARTAACVEMASDNGAWENVRDDMCLNFVKMVSWTLLYYGTQCEMSRTTFYPFHFAPFVSDLARMSVFKTSVLCERSIFKDRPWLFPIEQAILTQPRASRAIILDFPQLEDCEKVARLLDDAKEVIGETIIEGKNAEHQGTIIVKIPDFGKLSMIVNPPSNVPQKTKMMELRRPDGPERRRGTMSWADKISLKST